MKSTKYGADKNILIAPELAHTVGCIVGNTGVEANSEGRKIVKAGTPVGGTVDVLVERQTVLTTCNTADNGANAQGLLLHDVDVTEGDANATLIVAGVVDTAKLDVTIVDAAKNALTKIILQKGENR